MNTLKPATESSAGRCPPANAARFIYATGARPLEGFTIKRGIGAGGFGQVYYAVSDAGKEVALKHIQRNLDVELRGVSQCLNLKHPNLLSLFDVRYDEAGEAWVVMEYITGESLKDVIQRNPNGMPLDQISFWLAGTAAGVACLHDHGIVHRDLKPGNVFNDGGIVKVGDYGLSKFISVSRRSAQTESVGTFHYMAPEIGRGRYGREIDIYALGIMLFEMLTGDVPFDGESSQEIIMKHLTAEADLTPIAEPYRTVIARALEKDPEKRLGSVPEMFKLLNIAVPTAGAAPVIALAPLVPPVADAPRAKEAGGINSNAADAPSPAAELVIDDELDTLIISDKPIQPLPEGEGRAGAQGNEIQLGPVKVRADQVQPQRPPSQRLASQRPEAAWHRPAPPASPRRASAEVQTGGRFAKRWQQLARDELAARPLKERVTEMIGSLLMSAAVIGVLSVVIMVVAQKPLDGSFTQWGPQYAWLVLSGVGSAWAILLTAKWWEKEPGETAEQLPRRFILLAIGLLIGAIAFGIDAGLFLEMKFARSALYNQSGEPGLPAYLMYFGGLFVLLRWWLQADPLRSSRLAVWPTALSAFWGLFLPFPQPWGVLLAAAISVAVQTAAPWMTAEQRNRLKQQYRFQDARA